MTNYWLVYEYCDFTLELLLNAKGTKFSKDEELYVIKQLFTAIEFLHRNSVSFPFRYLNNFYQRPNILIPLDIIDNT